MFSATKDVAKDVLGSLGENSFDARAELRSRSGGRGSRERGEREERELGRLHRSGGRDGASFGTHGPLKPYGRSRGLACNGNFCLVAAHHHGTRRERGGTSGSSYAYAGIDEGVVLDAAGGVV
jgi:hypothetical protein